MVGPNDSSSAQPPGASADGPSADLVKLEEFIFVRELYEVFLLLDHISGRWDKVLRSNGAQSPSIIETICGIGLAPASDPQQRLRQAVELMSAKDTLNAIARPATGLTVAFTILVVGEENRRKPLGQLRRLCRDLFHNHAPAADHAAARRGCGGANWDKPTRVTLARYAYPGLIGVAIKFNRRIGWLVAFLLCALAFTCALSWHVSAGNVILQHLEEVRGRSAEVRKEISAAELKYAADERERAAGRGAAAPVVRFCKLGTEEAREYRSTEEYQLCQRDEALRDELRAVRLNLRDWLTPWKTAYKVLTAITARLDRWLTPAGEGTPVVAPPPEGVRRRGHEEKARIVTLVVGTSVLPLAYGVLGAGAAVVRRLWERMRESMLSPRDSTMALLQLALGGTIGACIALFINPSGPAPAEEHGLLGTWALSGSALSFIAGFGVEGVFRALEGFVHRVFGVHEGQPGEVERRDTGKRNPW
jgi:hypothetical protein